MVYRILDTDCFPRGIPRPNEFSLQEGTDKEEKGHHFLKRRGSAVAICWVAWRDVFPRMQHTYPWEDFRGHPKELLNFIT